MNINEAARSHAKRGAFVATLLGATTIFLGIAAQQSAVANAETYSCAAHLGFGAGAPLAPVSPSGPAGAERDCIAKCKHITDTTKLMVCILNCHGIGAQRAPVAAQLSPVASKPEPIGTPVSPVAVG